MLQFGKRKVKEYRRSTWGSDHKGKSRNLDQLIDDTNYLVTDLCQAHKNTDMLFEFIADCLRAVRKDLIVFNADHKGTPRYEQILRLNYEFHVRTLTWPLTDDSKHFNLMFLSESLSMSGNSNASKLEMLMVNENDSRNKTFYVSKNSSVAALLLCEYRIGNFVRCVRLIKNKLDFFEGIVASYFILPKALAGLVRHHRVSFKGKMERDDAIELFQTSELPKLTNIEIIA